MLVYKRIHIQLLETSELFTTNSVKQFEGTKRDMFFFINEMLLKTYFFLISSSIFLIKSNKDYHMYFIDL